MDWDKIIGAGSTILVPSLASYFAYRSGKEANRRELEREAKNAELDGLKTDITADEALENLRKSNIQMWDMIIGMRTQQEECHKLLNAMAEKIDKRTSEGLTIDLAERILKEYKLNPKIFARKEDPADGNHQNDEGPATP